MVKALTPVTISEPDSVSSPDATQEAIEPDEGSQSVDALAASQHPPTGMPTKLLELPVVDYDPKEEDDEGDDFELDEGDYVDDDDQDWWDDDDYYDEWDLWDDDLPSFVKFTNHAYGFDDDDPYYQTSQNTAIPETGYASVSDLAWLQREPDEQRFVEPTRWLMSFALPYLTQRSIVLNSKLECCKLGNSNEIYVWMSLPLTLNVSYKVVYRVTANGHGGVNIHVVTAHTRNTVEPTPLQEKTLWFKNRMVSVGDWLTWSELFALVI